MKMAVSFIETTHYVKYADPEVLAKLVYGLIIDTNKVILIDENNQGFIAGLITPFVFGTDLIASEFGWWVEPEARKTGLGQQLMEAFHTWAKENGCKMITLTSLDDDVGKLYEKAGYSLYERAYFKEI